MNGQAVLGKPLRQHFHQPPRVRLQLAADHEVVGKPDQKRTTLQSRLDFPHKPFVQHVVQVDVGQQRGDHPSLRRALLRVQQLASVQHSSTEPFSATKQCPE
jgi:hypothetical protein